MFSRTHHRRNPGFTLIELLVVISIIAVLVALTTAAVQKVREVGRRTQVTSEISQITLGLESFQQKMALREVACRGNGTAPPAQLLTNIGGFVLRSNYGVPGGSVVPDYTPTFEYRFLKQAFPNAELGQDNASFSNGLPNGVELDPSHLLVFWLGGYYAVINQSNPSQMTPVFGQGFNADARYPFAFVTPAASYPNAQPPGKKGPFYEFQPSRLSTIGNTATAGGQCPRYLDPWGTPYCFFATENGRDNNYAMRTNPPFNPAQCVKFDWNNGTVTTRIVPLLTKSNQFANQKSFQVFSAGRNKTFPFATTVVAPQLWSPGGGSFVENGLGGQNHSNFNPTIMAVAP